MDDIPLAPCLSELLDQDPSAYAFFQSLAPEVRDFLRQEDGGAPDQLQARARLLHPARRGYVL